MESGHEELSASLLFRGEKFQTRKDEAHSQIVFSLGQTSLNIVFKM